jgi:hypothetical protein
LFSFSAAASSTAVMVPSYRRWLLDLLHFSFSCLTTEVIVGFSVPFLFFLARLSDEKRPFHHRIIHARKCKYSLLESLVYYRTRPISFGVGAVLVPPSVAQKYEVCKRSSEAWKSESTKIRTPSIRPSARIPGYTLKRSRESKLNMPNLRV